MTRGLLYLLLFSVFMKLMTDIIRYDATSRDAFDKKTQAVLDLIQVQFTVVELEPPTESRGNQWFVQVYRKGKESSPEGFFGDTCLEAASRLAKALKIKL